MLRRVGSALGISHLDLKEASRVNNTAVGTAQKLSDWKNLVREMDEALSGCISSLHQAEKREQQGDKDVRIFQLEN